MNKMEKNCKIAAEWWKEKIKTVEVLETELFEYACVEKIKKCLEKENRVIVDSVFVSSLYPERAYVADKLRTIEDFVLVTRDSVEVKKVDNYFEPITSIH